MCLHVHLSCSTRRLLRSLSVSQIGCMSKLHGFELNSLVTPEQGKVPLISTDAIHQLHIFIFVLAVSHVLYCISTMAFGRLKMRRWKAWELETKTAEYQFSHGWHSYLWLPFIPLFVSVFKPGTGKTQQKAAFNP
ncbi:hypothetical protein BHM03_00042592 [Ensete ventricosum]|uniref:MLO-like protein n=1 Tax=Ensete ventricosum TaxID=4639 RepID=A0A427A145_ENSVE|nr:hypothetical protein B296_00005343 [Ensete ventricosum]RZS11279.1 hypothetical protein BHM03_00042592 [Ensete ventricosum]